MALSQYLEMKENLTSFSTTEKEVMTLFLPSKCSVKLFGECYSTIIWFNSWLSF